MIFAALISIVVVMPISVVVPLQSSSAPVTAPSTRILVSSSDSAASVSAAPAITIVTARQMTVVEMEVHGLGQTGPAFGDLHSYVSANYQSNGAPFGIYPADSHGMTNPSTMVWYVAQPISGAVEKLPAATPPYKLVSLPPQLTAVLQSTLDRVAKDGDAAVLWLKDHGYVQSGPTRMEFVGPGDSPETARVRLSIPIAPTTSPAGHNF